ncbi:MAG: hypothetical protein LBR68_04940 [Lachnoclostridium sp.]|nr:hypothetical protein [Lachnoclostridium sp.]
MADWGTQHGPKVVEGLKWAVGAVSAWVIGEQLSELNENVKNESIAVPQPVAVPLNGAEKKTVSAATAFSNSVNMVLSKAKMRARNGKTAKHHIVAKAAKGALQQEIY